MNKTFTLKSYYDNFEECISDALYLIDLKLSIPSNTWTPIDEALFGQKMLFNVENETAKKLRFNAIKYAFLNHYKNCKYYHNYCKKMEITPDEINNESDLVKIPMISAINFKAYENESNFVSWLNHIYVGELPKVEINKKRIGFDDVIDFLQEKDVTVTFSSGTTGRFSFVPRDFISWRRQQFAYAHSIELMPFLSNPFSYNGVLFMPNPRKTHLFLGRIALTALETLDMIDQSKIHFAIDRSLTTNLIKIIMGRDSGLKNRFLQGFVAIAQQKKINNFIHILSDCASKKENVLIGGQPFLINNLMSKLEKESLSFNFSDSILLTTGGWKVHQDIKINEKDFRMRVERVLGIPDERCRDLYGMVECSVLNVSCEGHYKHIPHSIIYPMVLDENYQPVGFGEYGRFAFLDPLANSYPGFIITNDRVKILEKCPVCNRSGPVIVEDVSRINEAEIFGCGAIMARMISKEVKKNF